MEPPDEVACPHCTSEEAEREFRTAPGYRSPATAFNDKTVRSLAADFNLSDVSNKDGQAVKRPASNTPGQFTQDASVMGKLARLGAAGDNASGVLPMLKAAGNPRNWNRQLLPPMRK